MKKEEIESKLLDFMQGKLTGEDKKQVEAYLAEQGQDLAEFHELSEVWNKLDLVETPAPSSKLRDKFYTNLADFKQDQRDRKVSIDFEKIKSLFQQRWLKQLSFALACIFIGVLVGYQMRGNQSLNRLENMASEMQQMKKVMMLSMLEQESASKRIQAVNMVHGLENVDDRIISLLLKSLNEDPNINVRMVAAEALKEFTSLPTVRQSLIEAISKQESPLVQLTLIDVLLSMKEQQAEQALKALIDNEKVNEAVRKKAALGIGENL